MANTQTLASKYDAHLLKAHELIRGEIEGAVAVSKLLLSVYGIKVLADPLNPNEQVQEAARIGWEALTLAHHSSSPVSVLGEATDALFQVLLGSDEPWNRSPTAPGSVMHALQSSAPESDSVQRVLPKLVRHAQQLWWFEDEAERTTFVERLIDSASQRVSRPLAEVFSESTLNQTLQSVATNWARVSPSTVYDPTVGTGSTLIEVARALSQHTIGRPDLYGQEVNLHALFFAAWRLAANDVYPIYLRWGDVLQDPKFVDEDGRLSRFDVVVAVPPFGIKIPQRSAFSKIEIDYHNRFQYGLPPSSTADWLFAQHALASTSADGLTIVVLASGALYRGGQEADIRRKLIMADQVSAVFLLPSGMHPSTQIQSAVLVMQPRKPDESKGVTRVFDISNVEPSEVPSAVSRALTDTESDVSSTTVTLDDFRANGYSLLPTPYLPPRDVRATLASREQAKAEIESALADLEQESRRFHEAMDGLDVLANRTI